MSDSPGLVDFAIGLVNSVINLPDGQVKFFEEFQLQKNCEINLLIKTFLGLAEMMFGLEDVCFTCPNGKLQKWLSLHPDNVCMFWLFLICRNFVVAQSICLHKHGFLSLQFVSYSLFSWENNAFSAMCDVCRKLVKPVFWNTYCEIFLLVLSVICTLLSEVASRKSNTIRYNQRYSVTHDSSCVSSQCTRHGRRWRYKRTDWQSAISGATC